MLLGGGYFFAGVPGARANGDTTKHLASPLTDADFHKTSDPVVKLGQFLFYDKILSGNQNIACSTCHHHKHASADGLSLPVGEGGVGLGPDRTIGSGEQMIEERVPRNSPALFNLGAKEFVSLFHDGRVSIDRNDPSGFDTPAEEDLPRGLKTVMAAQAMFPITSAVEMAGAFGESDVGNAANRGFEYVWPILEKRLQNIPEYVALFRRAFPEIDKASDIKMVHAANALAEFQMSEWRADNSPFDDYLRGDQAALSEHEIKGMDLFYGSAGCSTCHAGAIQTDHKFHAIAMPQIGYPLTRTFDPVVRDAGRINETNNLKDRYKFRTPSLRNIAQTAPYGHSGAYRTLRSVVRHHFDPLRAFKSYDRSQVVLADHPDLSKIDFMAMENLREVSVLLRANTLKRKDVSDDDIDALLVFLGALSDQKSLLGKLGPPKQVPSGLKMD